MAAERYELPPERLGRWLQRWADAHGGVAETRAGSAVVSYVAGDGAVVECEPQTAPYGARYYAVRDPEGFLWWVSNYMPSRP